jgi:hypothetical protein
LNITGEEMDPLGKGIPIFKMLPNLTGKRKLVKTGTNINV